MMKLTTCIGVFSLLLVGTGCSNKSGDETSADKTGASSTTSAELFAGQKASMPGPLAALAFGMDEAGVKKVLPALFEDEVNTYGTSRVASGKVGGSFVIVSFEFGELSKVEIPTENSPVDKATKAWGEPERAEMGASKKKALVWVDKDTGVRAVLIPSITEGEYSLQVSRYLSFESFASLDDKARPLTANLVLGADPATLLKTFPNNVAEGKVSESAKKRTEAMMKGMKDEMAAMGVTVDGKKERPNLVTNLPPTRLGDDNTSVVLHFGDDGRVRSLTTNLDGNDASLLGKDVTTAFDAAWGPAKVLDSPNGDTHHWYDAKRGVRVSARLGGDFGVALEAVRYMPLATLFGEPGVKWGFDKGPIVGSTPEEIKAAYGDAFAPYKESGSLKYPTTDYDNNVATTNINFHMKEGKVSSYYFGLDYGDYGPAQAEIQALFVAKFGEGKSDGKWVTYHDKDPKIRVRDSDITHSFDIEVE